MDKAIDLWALLGTPQVMFLAWSAQEAFQELGKRGLTAQGAATVAAILLALALELGTGKGSELLALVVATRAAVVEAQRAGGRKAQAKRSGLETGDVTADPVLTEPESATGKAQDAGKARALGPEWDAGSGSD